MRTRWEVPLEKQWLALEGSPHPLRGGSQSTLASVCVRGASKLVLVEQTQTVSVEKEWLFSAAEAMAAATDQVVVANPALFDTGTVSDLKSLIEAQTGCAAEFQELALGRTVMLDDDPIDQYAHDIRWGGQTAVRLAYRGPDVLTFLLPGLHEQFRTLACIDFATATASAVRKQFSVGHGLGVGLNWLDPEGLNFWLIFGQ